ncbi:XylR N-terminal domain-containing protein, partial [Roseateles sp.]|uniref:XylR N-terminal domain-containing protein n=1 Tax=Roseateles sp. TaxID=1971397 RepID=UPI0035A17B62
MGELLSMLRFNVGSGHIWLNEHRMMLLHTRALAGLRRELFDSLGVARARGLLVRMGFASGQRDGELAVREMHAGMPYEKAFMLGPQLHSIEGAVRVEKVHMELDLKAKHFVGEFLWTNS